VPLLTDMNIKLIKGHGNINKKKRFREGVL